MVIVRIWDGLGNQMFQYAYARALKAGGVDVRLDCGKKYDSVFKKYRKHDKRECTIQHFRISIPVVDSCALEKYSYLYQDDARDKIRYWLGSHFIGKYKFYEEKDLNFSLSKKNIKGNCYVKGWFQNEKYFKNIRRTLIKEFVPCEKIKLPYDLQVALKNTESVSVHIRRGDYVKLHQDLGSGYYKKAFSYINKIYSNPVFVIFSDDLEWVKKNIDIEGKYIYANEGGKLKDFEELFIMSRCKSNIIANSTFSWWAAWLNQNPQKIVIAPKNKWNWAKDIIPDEWVVL